MLRNDDKVAKTNLDKVQLFAESVERHFGIESECFDSNHFNEVSQFIEDNHRYFYLLKTQMTTDLIWAMSTSLWKMLTPTLIKLAKFLKRGKAPGSGTIHNEVLGLGSTTSLFHHLARIFTSRRLFLVPHCTLRPSHLSVGGNAWRLEIVGQLDM